MRNNGLVFECCAARNPYDIDGSRMQVNLIALSEVKYSIAHAKRLGAREQ